MLCFQHTWGVKPGVRGGVAHISDTDVVYPCGRNLVVHDTEQNLQKFAVLGHDAIGDIACMAISPSLKLVAIADRDTDQASIAIFDITTLKRRRHLAYPELVSKAYVSLSFSADSRLLLAQGGSPDFVLVMWHWEKTKAVCVGRVALAPEYPILEASSCTFDSSVACVIGTQTLKFLRSSEGQWKPTNSGKRPEASDDCLSMCWLPGERCIVSTTTGSLLLYESFELRVVLPEPEGGRDPIVKIVPFKRGFVCADVAGRVSVFDRSSERLEYFAQVHKVGIESFSSQDRVISLSVSPSFDHLLVSLDRGSCGQLVGLPFSTIEYNKEPTLAFEPLGAPLHCREITALDVCSNKPLLVTVSLDRSVRIWDYEEKHLVQSKEFPEDGLSVAMHPTSYFLLVGFSDKLRMLTVMLDDLKPIKEIPIKNCRCVKFASGGHVFAACHNNNVQLYDTYSCELLYNMRGHSARVKSVFFAERDHTLYSAGLDGGVHKWSTVNGARDAEVGSVVKGCSYNAVCCDSQGLVICAGHDNKLRVYTGNAIALELDVDSVITKLCLSDSERQLYASCEDGSLQVYSYPLTGEFETFHMHAAAITGLAMSVCDTMVFSSATDGTMAIYDVNDRETRARADKKEAKQWLQDVLVGRIELDEKSNVLRESESRIKTLISQNEYTVKINQKTHEDETKQLHESFEAQLQKEKNRYDYLLSEKNDMEMDFEEKSRHQEERQTAAMQELEGTYEMQLLQMGKQLKKLEEEKEAEAIKYEEQHEMLVEQHDKLLADIQDDFELRIAEQDKIIEQQGNEAEEQQRVLETLRTMIEQDCDMEILNLKTTFDKKLDKEKEQMLELKGNNGLVKKKNMLLQKQYDDQEARIRAVNDHAEELELKLQIAKRDNLALKKETKERDETINDKEKRIYELRKKNQELEKFKFVLDYKIKELRKQIEPKELEILGMKDTVTEMDAELDRYNKINQALELDNTSMQSKLDAIQKQSLRQRADFAEALNTNNRFRADLEETVQYIQDHKMLKASVKLLYQRHCGEFQNKASVNDDLHKEMSRQREYLEKSVDNLKKKLVKDAGLAHYEKQRHMNENSTLIKEINDLRREVKSLKAQNGRIVADMNFKNLANGNNPGDQGVGKKQRPQTATSRSSSGSRTGIRPASSGRMRGAVNNEVEMLHAEIFRLRQRVEELESKSDFPPNHGNPANAWLNTDN